MQPGRTSGAGRPPGARDAHGARTDRRPGRTSDRWRHGCGRTGARGRAEAVATRLAPAGSRLGQAGSAASHPHSAGAPDQAARSAGWKPGGGQPHREKSGITAHRPGSTCGAAPKAAVNRYAPDRGGSDGAELSGPDARHEAGERGGGDAQNRTARVLGVTDGDHAARGSQVGRDLDALTAVLTVRGLDPAGVSVVTGCPFAAGRSWPRMPLGRQLRPVADGRRSAWAARTYFPFPDGPVGPTRRTT